MLENMFDTFQNKIWICQIGCNFFLPLKRCSDFYIHFRALCNRDKSQHSYMAMSLLVDLNQLNVNLFYLSEHMSHFMSQVTSLFLLEINNCLIAFFVKAASFEFFCSNINASIFQNITYVCFDLAMVN